MISKALDGFIENKYWPVVVLVCFVILFWHPIFINNEFFADDTVILGAIRDGQFSLKYMLTPHNDHFMPLFKGIFFVVYKLFGRSIIPCMAVSIFIHILNSILFFILCKMIFPDRKWLPFFTAIFFSLNSSFYEVLHWFIVVNTSMSFLFLLLSLVFLHRYSNEKKTWMYVVSLVSSFFIPMGFTLGILGIAFIYLYAWFILKIRSIKIYAPYILPFLFFAAFYVTFVVLAGHSRTGVYSMNILDIAQYVLMGFFGAWFKSMGFSIAATPQTTILSGLLALQLIFVCYFLLFYFFLNRKDERVQILGDRNIMWFCLISAALCYAAIGIGRSQLSKDVFLYWGRYQYFPVAFLSILIGNAALPIFQVFAKIFNRRRLFVFFAVLFIFFLIIQFAVIRQKSLSSFRTEGALPSADLPV